MSNNKKTEVTPVEKAPVLPPEAKELSAGTVGVTLTAGKLYAIRDARKYSDDAQDILTEDIFRCSVPDGYYVVKAVAPRHFVSVHYEPTTDLEPGEITGFTPEFDVPEELETHPARERMRREFAGEKGSLLQQRSELLRRENSLVAKAVHPGSISNPDELVELS